MKMSRPVQTIFFIAMLLVSLGIACNQSKTSTTSNSAPPTSNTASATNTTSAATAVKDISGAYSITGLNESGGGQYGGNLNVTKRGDVYQFTWASGQRKYDGVGVQNENQVAVAFAEGADGKGCRVVLYKIKPDGELDGKTGWWGVETSATESAIRKSGTDLDGDYRVTGTNFDGSGYKGDLAVQKKAAGYAFNLDAGTPISGFGVRQGDKVAVGFGGKQCGFVSYEIKSDGTLDGKWGSANSSSIGTETAKKN